MRCKEEVLKKIKQFERKIEKLENEIREEEEKEVWADSGYVGYIRCCKKEIADLEAKIQALKWVMAKEERDE
jgi:DNA-binding protein YbaB